MSCNTCGQTNKCNHVDFALDGTYLVPSVSGVPGDGVDLQRAIVDGETDTRMQLDADNARIIYRGERYALEGIQDTIEITSLLGTGSIADLSDISIGLAGTGDILVYNQTTNKWESYTIPSGDSVGFLGLDLAGNIVKTDSTGGGGGSGVSKYIGESFSFWGQPASFPSGCVHLDGRELSRTVYSALFTILGTTYGAGNNTTTFNIPDTRDYTTVNVGTTTNFNAAGKKFGTATVALNAAQNGPHAHTIRDPGHSHATTRDPVVTSGGGNSRLVGGTGQQTAWSQGNLIAASGTGIWMDSSGSGSAHNNIQPSIARYELMRII